MSAVDGGGGRLVWIAKPQPKRGLQVIQAMVHDRDGLVRFGGVQMKRKELRAMTDEIKQKHGVSMIAVPWEFADRIIYEGYERAKARGPSGQSDLSDFHAIRSVIGTGKPKAVTHPVYQKLGTEDFRDGPWREQSRRLLEEPELRYWVIVDEWVQDCLAALHEAQSSPLVLNPVQKEERLASVVRDAVKTLCAGENGQAFKRRMEDMALYFAETGRIDAGQSRSRGGTASRRRRSRAVGRFVSHRADAKELCLFHVADESAARSPTESGAIVADHQAVGTASHPKMRFYD